MDKEKDVFKRIEEMIKECQIFGKPYKFEDMTFIPVLDVVIGCGLKEEGIKAGGGGVCLKPEAIILIRANKQVSIFSLEDKKISDKIKEKAEELRGDFNL